MDQQYAGFWIRAVAMFIDGLLILLIGGLVIITYLAITGGMEAVLDAEQGDLSAMVIDQIIFFIFFIWFWVRFRATPGKMLFGIEIVDADTGQNICIRQAIIRYLGYIPAILIFGLGILWIAIDKRKQGWHDKLAGTVALRKTEQERDFTL